MACSALTDLSIQLLLAQRVFAKFSQNVYPITEQVKLLSNENNVSFETDFLRFVLYLRWIVVFMERHIILFDL
ncbi:MAG: hypothetical protein ACJA04_000595 [Cellvibrionaceae bacterium]|jgi:hypothetical protein